MVIATISRPEWFLGIDALFEGFSALVALLVFFAAYKIYLFTNERKYKYFSASFALLAYIILLVLTLKIKDKKIVGLFLLMSMILILFSSSYYLSFYSMSLIILAFITYQYKINYCKHKTKSCFWVLIAFLLLTLTQLQFLLNLYIAVFYVTAYLTKLLGFSALFLALIKVYK